MSSEPMRDHPTDATLAAFVEERLDAAEHTAVLAHVERCRDCMAAVLSANAHLEEERAIAHPPARATHWWMAIAAAVLIAAITVPLLLRREGGPIGKLVALAPRSARPVEPRLTGGFAWAPYSGANRAAGDTKTAEQLKLGGAAGEIVERAESDKGAEAQHAAGVAMVLIQTPAEAISRLETAAKQSNDAKSWSDLAAARYAAASQLGRASLYPTALAAADSALRIDPNLPEALFNRALILERLGLADEARQAWQRYLEVDPSSPWAGEARSHLAMLPAATHASRFERDRPLLEAAAERNDAEAVRRYVDAHRERARAWAEGEYLGFWAEALKRGDAKETARWLTIARAIGDALQERSGEALLRDAVRAIDSASPADRNAIAAAHILYRNGRIAYSRGQREEGVRNLLRAADAFDAARDPMALQARYYAASARLAGNDATGARAELGRILAAADAHPDYLSLGAHVRWELGRALSYDDNWVDAAAVLADGAAMLRRSGERRSEATMDLILASALNSLERNDDAWLARMQGLAALSAEGEAEYLTTGIAAAMNAELSVGHHDAALSFSALQTSVARRGAQPHVVINALVSRALLQSMSGDPAGAQQTAREADALTGTVADPELRAGCSAIAAVAAGAALADSSPRAAADSLTRAIDFFTARNLPAKLTDPLLLRARCAARAGDAAAAMRDLERGMTIVESHPAAVNGAAAGTGVLDAEHALYEEAIRLSLDRGDVGSAFTIAERARGSALTPAELQRRLAGSGTAVVELVALPHELVTFAVAENAVLSARRPNATETIAALADQSLSEPGTAAASRLYDELIRPVDAALDRAREIVIVADRRLETVPYAALYDGVQRRFLIERFPVATASSAGSLQPEQRRTARPALAAIALPTGGEESAGLPEAENEVRDVTGLYARATSIPAANATFAQLRSAAAAADVVHIAGHTERQPGGGEQALMFAGAPGKIERVSWKTILAAPSPNRGVVVLAACETLRPPPSAATRALSLGAAFSAAGASDVVGTLAPIGDRDARQLFGALHRRLASGARPAEAFRDALLEAMGAATSNGGEARAWRAIALLTRHTAAP